MTAFKTEFITPTPDRLADEQPVFTLSKLRTDLGPERREAVSPVRGFEDLVKHLAELSTILCIKDQRSHLRLLCRRSMCVIDRVLLAIFEKFRCL
jgi:hypothetical protein